MPEVPKQEVREAQGSEQIDGLWSGAKEFFGKHPTLVLTLLYLYATAVGLIYSASLYGRFGINIFDYSEISDFLLAAIKFPWVFAPTVILLSGPLGVWAYEKVMQMKVIHADLPRSRYEVAVAHGFMWWQVFAYTIILVLFILVGTYLFARFQASSIKDGENPPVDVRYRSFSSSAGQVTEPRLQVIGSTQKVVFFYDVDAKRTLVIPQAQIVTIEVPE